MAQLCQHQDELDQLNVEVLLVSFSSTGYARTWIEQVCSVFHLLLDRERDVYRLYGLKSSILRSWSLKTVRGYIRLMRAGRKWAGIQGDSAQLGGDFVIDNQGVLRLAHRSQDPTDRPPVETLLDTLRQLREQD